MRENKIKGSRSLDGGIVVFPRPQTPGSWQVMWRTGIGRLSFDLDLAASQALYVVPDADGGRAVPESINTVASAGVTVKDGSGWSGSLRLRYFGPRDLISTAEARSGSTTILNAAVGYQFNPRWQATVEILNLLNSSDQDIAYYYESKVTPTAAAVTQVHFHPVEPRQFRLSVTGRL
jgi:outer membrane receptor protein involved in Fe transport